MTYPATNGFWTKNGIVVATPDAGSTYVFTKMDQNTAGSTTLDDIGKGKLPDTGRSIMAMQVDLDQIEGPQQGSALITNASWVLLAGMAPGSMQYYTGK